MKAQPSNRMKTEEELAKEEQARLQRLEVGRRTEPGPRLVGGAVACVPGLSLCFAL